MAANKVIFLLIAIIFISINDSFALRRFWRGRRYGGNLYTSFHLNRKVLPPAKWFEQKLDHFDEANKQTWKQVSQENIVMYYNSNYFTIRNDTMPFLQRYYVNEKYYKKNGPIFLMIGGEGEATSGTMLRGAWVHYAKKINALCIQLEHRFYGKSRPTKYVSLSI